MKNPNLIKVLSILCAFILLASCSNESEIKKAPKTNDLPTITSSPNSKYNKTFKELNLGEVLAFNLETPRADKRWIELWVDRYKDGVKDEIAFATLSYGNDPNIFSEGHLGFGLLNVDDKNAIPILYAPDGSTRQSPVKLHEGDRWMSTWMYALDEKKKTKIALDKVVTLGLYREVTGNSMRTGDLQDKEELKRIIQEDHQVLVLRIKITEKKVDR